MLLIHISLYDVMLLVHISATQPSYVHLCAPNTYNIT